MSLPDPLTPIDCDLRAFRDMPLDVGRFRDSDLVTEESPDAIVAALLLWGTAWHQVPAASIPDNDRWLAKAAGYGRAVDSWLRIREGALRGFVACADGRLYHRTLAEKANAAWDRRLAYDWNKAKDRHRKAQKDLPEAQRTEFPDFDSWKQGRAAAPALPSPELELPLESTGNSGGTSSERAPARPERAHPERARTGATGMPPDNSAGTDTPFQRNDSEIPLENALKGEERRGILLYTQPDSPHSDSREAEAPPEAGSGGRLDDRDLVALLDAVQEASGYRPVSPGAIDRAMKQVEDWRDRGYDFDLIVIPTIKAVVADSAEPTRTLGRFRDRIAHEHARAKAKGEAGRSYKPPASPILQRDDEDETIRPFRQALLDKLGPQGFCLYINPLRFEPVRDAGGTRLPIRAIGPPHSTAHLLDGDRAHIIRSAATQSGFTDVW